MSLQVEIEKKLNDKVLSVSFDTEGKQGITGILGASGCGKSMTLKCIAGIETPDRGKIVLNGRVLFDSGKKINLRVQDRHVGYLFQNYALFPNMTVEKNIAAGFQYRPGQKMSAEEIKKQTADYMELLHVTELKSSYPGKLSGGQQQRVALAQSTPQPSSLRMRKTAGVGRALTAKYSRKSSISPKASLSARAVWRMPRSL